MDLSTAQWTAIAIGAVVIVAVALVIIMMMRRHHQRRRRSEKLQRSFGPEYDAAIDQMGRKRGEADLEDRSRQFRGLDFKDLNAPSREALTNRWAEFQYRFVEDPTYSVREADHLVQQLLHERGYPSESAETLRALSANSPELARLYRQANDAYRRTDDGEGPVDQQFEAMVSYRRFLHGLLEESAPKGSRGTKQERRARPLTQRS